MLPHSARLMADRAPAALGAFAAGLGASALFASPVLAFAALTLAAVGIMTSMANFWALPTGALAGSAAAGGIALVNSVGNLGGFGGSYLVGYLRQSSNGFQSSLVFLSVCPLIAAVILYAMAGWQRGAGSRTAAPTPLREPV